MPISRPKSDETYFGVGFSNNLETLLFKQVRLNSSVWYTDRQKSLFGLGTG